MPSEGQLHQSTQSYVLRKDKLIMLDINTLFLTAAKSKFRFSSAIGVLLVEDLFDLELTGKSANLDDIARSLHRSLKEADDDVSFLRPAVKTHNQLQEKFEIVKYVIEQKLAERDLKAATREKAMKKQKIMAKLAEKKDKALDDLSVETLETMLNDL